VAAGPAEGVGGGSAGTPADAAAEGYLRPEPIQTLWHEHLSGRFDHTSKTWIALMWQAWLAERG